MDVGLITQAVSDGKRARAYAASIGLTSTPRACRVTEVEGTMLTLSEEDMETLLALKPANISAEDKPLTASEDLPSSGAHHEAAPTSETDWRALVEGSVGLSDDELWRLSGVMAGQLADDEIIARGGGEGRLSGLALHCPRVGGDNAPHDDAAAPSRLGNMIARRLSPELSGAGADATRPPLPDVIRYGQLLTSLTRAARAGELQRAAAVSGAAAYAALKARPLADEVLQPKPMPVEVAPPAELAPFFQFLKDGGRTAPLPDDGGIVEFGRGIYAADGRMDLCKQVVGPQSIGSLMESLQGNDFVKHFLLGNNLVGRKGGKAVADYIRAGGSKIVTWYLAGNCLDAEAVGWIAAALESDTTVEALWLKRNPVLPAGCGSLARMLSANTTLRTLDLDNCGILDEGVQLLMAGLKSNAGSLRSLYLSANGIGPDGAAAVADYFRSAAGAAAGLEDLYMSVNRIGDDGAVALAGALAGSRIKRLVLSSNRIEARGAAALSAALAGHPSLEVLDLGMFVSTEDMQELPNRIGDEGAAAVAALLAAEGCRLKVLSLARNGMTQVGWRAVAAVAAKSTTLLHVDMTEAALLRGRGALRLALEAALAANVHAAYGEAMTREHFVAHELRYVRSEPASVRAIDSFYRNRAFRDPQQRKVVQKRWERGDTTLDQLALEGEEL